MNKDILKNVKDKSTNKGRLILIPSLLADGAINSLSKDIIYWANNLKLFVVENAKTARKFLKPILTKQVLQELMFWEIDKHEQIPNYKEPLSWLKNGQNVGLLSEAGCPAIADPGNVFVRMAHKQGTRVIPLAGPSSILLALMASGMIGQRFCFHGYLSKNRGEVAKDIRRLEARSMRDGETQIFMETPFRNTQMVEVLLSTLKYETLLCIAVNLTAQNESIITKPIKEWRKYRKLDIHKQPAIFLILA